MKPKHYRHEENEQGQWPDPERPLPFTKLVGPGLDFDSVYQVGQDNLDRILRALEAAYEAGMHAKAYEVRRVLGVREPWER